MYGKYKLLDIFSPSCRLEQFLQGQQTLVDVDAQDRIEVVRRLHLGAKAHDNEDLFVGIEVVVFKIYHCILRTKKRHPEPKAKDPDPRLFPDGENTAGLDASWPTACQHDDNGSFFA